MRPEIRSNARERGAVLVFVILLLPILIGFVGLAIDASSIYAERQHMRTAVDAAAKAGAMQISRGLPATVVNAARNDASLNGYTHGVSGVTATVNTPPASGPHGGDAAYVEVILQKQVPTYFIKILYPQAITVRARAVAGPGGAPQKGYYCLISLDPGWVSNAFDNVLYSQLSLPDCGIYVNSTYDQFLTGSLRAAAHSVITASDIRLVGSADIADNAIVTPTPVEGADVIPDPLAALPNLALPIRNTANCSSQNRSYSNSDNGITLQPGVYCGGIVVREQPTIYFAPGIYYLIGGGLKQNSNSKLIGSGVTFIVTGRDAPAYLRYDGVDIGGGDGQGNRDVTFSAPTSGATAGLLFYQDPSIVNFLKTSYFGGGGQSDLKLTGILYFPSTEAQYTMPTTDPAAAGDYTMVFAKTLKFQGNARLNAISNPPWPLPGGPPQIVGGNGMVTLVE